MNVRTLCLGALIGGPATGYEIRKMFEDGQFSYFQVASLGAIYPALTRLTEEGLVTFTEQEQSARPDKKVYQLTDAGIGEFQRALLQMKPAPEHYRSDILFALCFSNLLPVAVVDHLIGEYLARYRTEIHEIDSECAQTGHLDAGPLFVAGIGKAVCNAIVDYIETHRSGFIATLNSRAGLAHPSRAADAGQPNTESQP